MTSGFPAQPSLDAERKVGRRKDRERRRWRAGRKGDMGT